MITIRELLKLVKRPGMKVCIYSMRNHFICKTTTSTYETLKDSLLDINVNKINFFGGGSIVFGSDDKIEIYIDYESEEE